MITDVIVLSSVGFALVFLAAWAVRPDVREWIERPKHGFQDAVRKYDLARSKPVDMKGATRRD